MNTIIMSILAGVIGMGLGGAITAIFGTKTDRMISIFLSLAAGVMISIVMIELVPEAIEYANVWVAVVGLVLGALMVMFLNNLIDFMSKSKKTESKMHETYAEFFHSEGLTDSKKSMLRSGMIMLFAIALHNIPEGMAISAPLISGGLSRIKTLLLVMITGATTVIGAVAGMLIGGISDLTLALSFAVAGGAMLYVVFGEILPQSIVTNKDRIPAVFALVGIVVGLLFTQI